MGKTIPPFRPALFMEIESWRDFQRALRPAELRPFVDQIMFYAKDHADAGSMACRPLLSEVIFMCALIEQQKQIAELTQIIGKMKEEFEVLKQIDSEKIP